MLPSDACSLVRKIGETLVRHYALKAKLEVTDFAVDYEGLVTDVTTLNVPPN